MLSENGTKLCVATGSVSTISSFTKYGGVWMSSCVKFLLPLRVSCVFINVEFELLSYNLGL